jgi:hypothetical protein
VEHKSSRIVLINERDSEDEAETGFTEKSRNSRVHKELPEAGRGREGSFLGAFATSLILDRWPPERCSLNLPHL